MVREPCGVVTELDYLKQTILLPKMGKINQALGFFEFT